MEMLIKLDKRLYKNAKHHTLISSEIDEICDVIANGIQLPKGHGRLIAEPTEEEIAKTIGGKNDFADCIRDAVKTVFYNAPTIVEAKRSDKE